MARTHQYTPTIHWTGNRGTGTSSYRDYARTHEIAGAGKPTIPGSADRAFRGDRDHWNPEELLVVSLAQCHMLWYLHLAADAGVVVTDYADEPLGTMAEEPQRSVHRSGAEAGRHRGRAVDGPARERPARRRSCDVLHRPLGELPGGSRSHHPDRAAEPLVRAASRHGEPANRVILGA